MTPKYIAVAATVPISLTTEAHRPVDGHVESLVDFARQYKGTDTFALYVDEQVHYPPTLLDMYIKKSPEIYALIQKQIPASKGAVLGLSGTVLKQGPHADLDQEFAALTGTVTDIAMEKDCPTTTSTVHMLDRKFSMLIHVSSLGDDFTAAHSASDTTLANYFNSKNISQVQICDIYMNRYLLEDLGYFQKYGNQK